MTTLTLDEPTAPVAPPDGHPPGALRRWLRDCRVMTRRNLLHVAREPMQLSDVTVQPVLFTVLFVFVFGASMVLPGGGDTKDFLVPGLLALNLTTSMAGTAVGLSSDLHTGVIDRFRTLPMASSTVLVGRSVSDLLSAVVCSAFVLVTGAAIGWRPTTGLVQVVAGVGLALLFACAVSWFCAVIGLAADGPESAQAMSFLVVFPLAFVSNAFAPTQDMPWLLARIAEWNPVSAVTAAVRELFGNPNPSAAVDAWPMQHPVWAAILWSLLLLVVCVPLATHRYRRRTSA